MAADDKTDESTPEPVNELTDAAPSTNSDSTVVPFRSREQRLVRDVIGEVLREERMNQQRTLGDVAEEAAVSLPYLSEVERGKKDVSSEVLVAIATALDLDTAEVLRRSADRLRVEGSAALAFRLAA